MPVQGGTPRKLCDLPEQWAPGVGYTVNADETLLLGGNTRDVKDNSSVLYTINLKTGEVKVIHREKHDVGHVQFSPTDPDLCMFCHEGNWGAVDRIWFINPSKSVTKPDGTVVRPWPRPRDRAPAPA